MTSALKDEVVTYWRVPRCWPGEAVAILAGGQSLTREQVDHCRGRCRVIAINRAFEIAPWADWLFGCDVDQFWAWYPDALRFAGWKVAVRVRSASMTTDYLAKMAELAAAGVKFLRHTSRWNVRTLVYEGVSDDPGVVYGHNSLQQILSVIAHTGVARVLLLGADMHGKHWHGGYDGRASEPDYPIQLVRLPTLAEPLRERGIEVINCAPGSAIECWPFARIEEALPGA